MPKTGVSKGGIERSDPSLFGFFLGSTVLSQGERMVEICEARRPIVYSYLKASMGLSFAALFAGA